MQILEIELLIFGSNFESSTLRDTTLTFTPVGQLMKCKMSVD